MRADVPMDSTEARERREAAAEAEADELLERQRHHAECVGGWRGEDDDGHPIACTTCRPHLLHVDCRTCSTSHTDCQVQVDLRQGRCCGYCNHTPRGATRP